jgi:hypothetical protein
MFCPKCGAQVNDRARFCVHCGADIVGAKASGVPRVTMKNEAEETPRYRSYEEKAEEPPRYRSHEEKAEETPGYQSYDDMLEEEMIAYAQAEAEKAIAKGKTPNRAAIGFKVFWKAHMRNEKRNYARNTIWKIVLTAIAIALIFIKHYLDR